LHADLVAIEDPKVFHWSSCVSVRPRRKHPERHRRKRRDPGKVSELSSHDRWTADTCSQDRLLHQKGEGPSASAQEALPFHPHLDGVLDVVRQPTSNRYCS